MADAGKQADQQGSPPAEAPVAPAPETTEVDSDALVNLHEGTGLDTGQTRAVTTKSLTRLLVIAGAADSGKTTLLASLYECFQENDFAGYSFAGSLSLPALEMRCHLARLACGRQKSETERTKGSGQEPRLLHFRVRRLDLALPAVDLLIPDLPGEVFRMARDSTEECASMTLLRRADHFILLVDGKKLVALDHRHEAVNDAFTLLRSCLDAEMLGAWSRVDVVFAKSDYLTSDSGGGSRAFLSETEVKFRQAFEQQVGKLRFLQVAARPEQDPSLPFGYGLKGVFPSWVEEGRLGPATGPARADLALTSEFDRYLERHLPDSQKGEPGDVPR